MSEFSFIHIPKNAGTSFKLLIENDARLKDFVSYVAHNSPAECFEKSRKRLIVFRDPAKRFCSAFYYRLSLLPTCREWAKEEGINSPEKYIEYLIKTMQRWNPIMSLRADQQSVAGHPIAPTVWVFQPQSLWFRSPHSILLQENLNREWEYFCRETGVPFVELPRENARKNSLDADDHPILGNESMSFLRHIYSGDYALWDLLKNMPTKNRIKMTYQATA